MHYYGSLNIVQSKNILYNIIIKLLISCFKKSDNLSYNVLSIFISFDFLKCAAMLDNIQKSVITI